MSMDFGGSSASSARGFGLGAPPTAFGGFGLGASGAADAPRPRWGQSPSFSAQVHKIGSSVGSAPSLSPLGSTAAGLSASTLGSPGHGHNGSGLSASTLGSPGRGYNGLGLSASTLGSPGRGYNSVSSLPVSVDSGSRGWSSPSKPSCFGASASEAGAAVGGEVSLKKEPGFSGFGFEIADGLDGRTLLITGITTFGLLSCWNRAHPEATLAEGDTLVSVNGISGDADAMRRTLIESQQVRIRASRRARR
mmetsp:Transcript_91370/g.261550  ORF Transcript_91370/g.261550 Transcript_91370/m.261550 type:complete len:250 (-) Transcript_91370:15-764(-)